LENYLRLDLKILRSKAFKDFLRSPEAPIWFYLYSYTIRGQLSSCGFGKKLYEDFYLKKKENSRSLGHQGYCAKSWIQKQWTRFKPHRQIGKKVGHHQEKTNAIIRQPLSECL